jgi:hypothetical protein
MATYQFKYVGDLNGSAHPTIMTVPLNNVKMTVGDCVALALSAQAGYLGLATTSKPMLGVLIGFVHKDGRPVTPSDLPASATTTSKGPTCLDLTVSADGDALGQVSVSQTAVYSAGCNTAPTSTTYYGGTGCAVTIATGAQYITLGTPGTVTDLDTMIIPWGMGQGLKGIDVNDANRAYVIFSSHELFAGSYEIV